MEVVFADGGYRVEWMTYQTPWQFRELMALIKGLGDQVHLVKMREPGGIQLQDLLERPLRQFHASEGSRYAASNDAVARWQIRMLDLPGCLARTHLRGGPLRFNLHLSDPIERFLDDTAPWRGISGEYVVTLGPASSAEAGADAALPTLTASAGAFSRMWMGVRPASGLAATDALSVSAGDSPWRGPPELLRRLDAVLCLPQPNPDWGVF
ncbi:MAG: sterol carrier protein domain-containing protein [Chloroflexi bacterium]|nr:sterol carrier protein domain-containing protein [Chloroflexota bacterium]